MVRILIADDHDVIRRGLRDIISGQKDWSVCAEARNGREAVSRAKELIPDVAILDFQMPNLNGLEAAREIHKECPKIEILMISADSSEELIRTMVDAGIRAFIDKSDSGHDLVLAVQALLRHMPYFTSFVMSNILDTTLGNHGKSPQLTPREREILLLIAAGKSSREISRTLNISQKTAETHRTNLMRKLNVHGISDLVRYALRNKFIDP